MVHRDIELCRLTGARIHLLHLSTARQRRAGAGGQGRRAAGHRRGRAAPLQPHRRGAARLRPGVQGQPAAAHRRRRRRARAPGWPTARSTPSPPTTPRTRPRTRSGRSTRRRPGCSGWRRRSACACSAAARHAARRRRRRAVVAAGGDRRGRRPPRPADRRRASRPTSSCSIPTATLGGRAGALGQPQPQHAVRRPDAARPGPPHGARRRADRRSTGWRQR